MLSYFPGNATKKRTEQRTEAIIRFSKWSLTEEMVGDESFAEYIKKCYKK